MKNEIHVYKIKEKHVDVLIPHIEGKREDGLEKCLTSIDNQTYPSRYINTIVLSDNGECTVPQKVEMGIERTDGEYIVYAANDTELDTHCIEKAIEASIQHKKSLIAFNEGPVYPDKGNICTHWLIRRDFLPQLQDGMAFHTDFHHAGCDNWLHAQAEKLDQFYWCEGAIIHHHHFTKGASMDSVYEKAYSHVEQDRRILSEKLASLANMSIQ